LAHPPAQTIRDYDYDPQPRISVLRKTCDLLSGVACITNMHQYHEQMILCTNALLESTTEGTRDPVSESVWEIHSQIWGGKALIPTSAHFNKHTRQGGIRLSYAQRRHLTYFFGVTEDEVRHFYLFYSYGPARLS
jgi:hypothetical protein